MLRLEVREDNSRAIRIYEKSGYRKIGREPGYYEDGATALRYEKTLRGDIPVATRVPFYQQTCEFTCGPCCLMMAMANFDSGFVPDPVMEIRLWRESTTVFMMSGPGGCEPFGLAVAGHEKRALGGSLRVLLRRAVPAVRAQRGQAPRHGTGADRLSAPRGTLRHTGELPSVRHR